MKPIHKWQPLWRMISVIPVDSRNRPLSCFFCGANLEKPLTLSWHSDRIQISARARLASVDFYSGEKEQHEQRQRRVTPLARALSIECLKMWKTRSANRLKSFHLDCSPRRWICLLIERSRSISYDVRLECVHGDQQHLIVLARTTPS